MCREVASRAWRRGVRGLRHCCAIINPCNNPCILQGTSRPSVSRRYRRRQLNSSFVLDARAHSHIYMADQKIQQIPHVFPPGRVSGSARVPEPRVCRSLCIRFPLKLDCLTWTQDRVLEQRGSGKRGSCCLVKVFHRRQFAALPVSHWQLAEPPTTRRNRPRLSSPDSRRMSREKPSCIPPWQRIPVGNPVCGEKVASTTLGDAFVPAVSDRSQAT